MTAQGHFNGVAALGEPRVLVLHRHATVRLGLEAILHDHGLGVIRDADQRRGRFDFTTARDEVDVIVTDFDHSSDHVLSADTSLVVVVESESARTWARVLSEGARGLICLSWSPPAIALSVRVAHAGLVAVSFHVIRETISSETPEGTLDTETPEGTLDTTELQLLRDIAAGHTIQELAELHGYSERTVSRRIHRLNHMLGASDRLSVVAVALEAGLLSDQSPDDIGESSSSRMA